MKNPIIAKLNGITWSFIITGIVLIILAILIAWWPPMLYIITALAVLIIGILFIYYGIKVNHFKKTIEKYWKF